MSMTRFYVLAIATGFLLAATEPSLAAKQPVQKTRTRRVALNRNLARSSPTVQRFGRIAGTRTRIAATRTRTPRG